MHVTSHPLSGAISSQNLIKMGTTEEIIGLHYINTISEEMYEVQYLLVGISSLCNARTILLRTRKSSWHRLQHKVPHDCINEHF